MNELLSLIPAWIAGLALGLFYFGGLWLTVRQLPESSAPAVLFPISFLVRTVVTLGGFYLVMGNRWEKAVACLIGFILMRLVFQARLRPDRVLNTPPGKETVTE